MSVDLPVSWDTQTIATRAYRQSSSFFRRRRALPRIVSDSFNIQKATPRLTPYWRIYCSIRSYCLLVLGGLSKGDEGTSPGL